MDRPSSARRRLLSDSVVVWGKSNDFTDDLNTAIFYLEKIGSHALHFVLGVGLCELRDVQRVQFMVRTRPQLLA